MACRFPGAKDLASFRGLLEDGGDAVTDGRPEGGPWEGVAGDPAEGEAICRRGGFVDGIDLFDNRFFRMSPIEARMMDPRQRMLLETTWHALEDAGIDPDGLRGSRTGVYAGIGSCEYRDVIAASGQEDLYFGTSASIGIGRIAFVLGLEGPAMPVDMACASSLAAVHQAAAALRRGEVDMALAAGVNATLSPSVMRFHRDWGMLSRAGRCNAFDASADGFVRGEGCGVLVLRRLGDAEADGDRIWGLVRGSAVNQSGAGTALPAPHGPAQERLIEEALADAGVPPSEVDYLEAHGTGTELGDSVELRAVAAAYGHGRDPARPLLVGSVKTNIGHLEWAAGMASLIKAALAMNSGVIPAHLHFREPNPDFDWDAMPLRITSKTTPWPPAPGRPPLAAAHAFGLSGSNAHVVLEGCPSQAGRPAPGGVTPWPAGPPTPVGDALPGAAPARTARLLPLSGKSPDALRDLARGYLRWLDGHAAGACPETLADMAWTAGVGRSHFAHRAGLVFRTGAELRTALGALAGRGDDSGRSEPGAGATAAFVYAGGEEPWAGMGEALYSSEPAARAVLERCDRLVREGRGASLLDVMFGRAGAAGVLDDPAWARPAVYALQAALTALWESVGIRPGRVLGLGPGEIAAARAAGLLSLEDGLRLAADLTDPDAAPPAVATARPAPTMVSAVTGRVVGPSDDLGGDHWRCLDGESAPLRRRVEALAGAGADLVIEIGPRTEPGPVAAHLWPRDGGAGRAPVFIDGLVRPGPGAEDWGEGFARAVAAAYEAGSQISFDGLFAGERRRRIAIPGYPFQRRRFWVQPRGDGPR